MYTIISATGRANSNTKKVANLYQQHLQALGIDAKLFDLQTITTTQRDAAFIAMEAEFLIPAQKLIIIMPEYNGSMPGIFKLMMDMSDMKQVWWGKKALLTGVASGRAGNNRGMDHLTNILNYVKVNVCYNKIPLSQIDTEITEDGQFIKESTIALVNKQLQEFIAF
jgi:chromate reductase, NAD(P)H dehydrogenase (quinone)